MKDGCVTMLSHLKQRNHGSLDGLIDLMKQ